MDDTKGSRLSYVLPLAEIGLGDVDQVGMKAAVLGDLTKAGFPVPGGFAVTTGALRDTLSRGELGTATLPAELAGQVRAALHELGDGPVAVRSSGVAEDLAGRSFAGMYESYLNVDGTDAVLAAVLDCWRSGFSARVAAYHETSAQVGVLVQRMVPATVAGVAFSVNPVSRREDEIAVSAVTGLGDALMSGERTADEWTVTAGAATRNCAGPEAISEPDVRRVAELVSRVAAHAGSPQDMEWAIADGTLHVLQARPITGLAAVPQIPLSDEVPPGFWAQAPNVDTAWVPMQRSVFLPIFDAVTSNIFRFTTGGRATARMINGWTYLAMRHDTPQVQVQKLEQIGAAVEAGEPQALVRRWNDEWKPGFAAEIARLRAAPLGALDDAAFSAHFRDLVRVFADLHDVYFTLAGAAIALIGELGVVCAVLLDFTPAQTLALRGGLTGDHVPATSGLGELARMAAADPQTRAAVENGGSLPPDFAAAFDRYVAAYGHRTIGFDITQPTLAEQPGTLLNLVAAQLDQPYDLDAERAKLAAVRDEALATARARLAGATPEQRARFDRALAGSDAGAPVRDEKVFYAVSAWALLRYATQELGRRLHARDLVDDDGDGFFVALDDGLGALRDGTDLRATVRIGKGEHSWALAHPGPPVYGEFSMPPQPDDVPLSVAAQRVQAASVWAMSLRGGPPGGRDGNTLTGIAASAGRYTGPVRVIGGVTEFGRLRRGDVLVCQETTSQWAVLFPVVGGLVTDNGSLLSHPAIIAREYGVPAVVATGSATATLSDGQLVTVDGSAGTVTVLET